MIRVTEMAYKIKPFFHFSSSKQFKMMESFDHKAVPRKVKTDQERQRDVGAQMICH
jgi:hypothetical protein